MEYVMILVDFSQVMISNIMMQLANNESKLNEDMVRHMVLSSIRLYKKKFGTEYGEIVICADGPSYWRREIYPQYKASRKKARDKSQHDWSTIFGALHKIRDEMTDNMPYPVLRFERAEADDIIGALCHEYGQHGVVTERILIVSGDKDFAQLQKYDNVAQYSPIAKKFITPDVNPERFKQYHILQGDSGDGVPNFLSDDDTFVSGGRQKPLPKKKLEEWTLMQPEAYCSGEMLRNYHRNKMLVDLDCIPDDLQKQITSTFATYTRNPRSKIFNYFIEHRLRQLTDAISEF
jgi:5'-3' exonuclease